MKANKDRQSGIAENFALKIERNDSKMKKWFTVWVAAVIALAMSFTACSSKSSTSGTASQKPPASSSSSAAESGNSKNEQSTAPEDSGTASGSETEGSRTGADADIQSIYTGIKDVYGEDYLPDRVLTEAEIEERTGISSEDYLEAYGESATLDEKPDVFLAFRAKSGKEDEIKKKLEEYKSKLISDYPDYKSKVSGAEVYSNGDHVFLVCLGKDDNMLEDFGDEIKKGIDEIKSFFE